MKFLFKNSSGSGASVHWKHKGHGWRRAISALLCFVLLSGNAAGALAEESAADESIIAAQENAQGANDSPPMADALQETDTQEKTETTPPADSGEQTELPEAAGEGCCKHHPAHDEACGYTEENPVCAFVCAICPVQQQIDDILSLLEQLEQPDAEELDEEATLELYDKLLAAIHAYNLLTPEQRAEITGIDTLEMVLETLDIQTLTEGSMEITTAVIRAEGASEQNLTDGGTFNVDFSRQFTLHIVIKSTLNLPNKKVAITVPDGLTVVEYPIPERGGMAESVTPENIGDLNSANSYGEYRPKNGTITYSLKNTAEENSFNIILAPDTTLWNRKSGQQLEPLTVRVYTDGEDGTTYQSRSAKPVIIGKYNAAAGDTRAIQTGPRLSRVGVKSGVPTAAGQPFSLRQVWVNPDKDYIDMPQFFKKLEITLALPYYEKNDAAKTKVYAQFDSITYDPAGMSTRPNLLDPAIHASENGFNFTQTTNADNTVTLTWENLYLQYGQDYFTPYFKWTDGNTPADGATVKWVSDSIHDTGNTAPGCYLGGEPTTGSSAVGGKITWADGSVWYPWNNQFSNLSFTAHDGESMTVTGAQVPDIYNAKDSSIVYCLGHFQVVNQGSSASAPKTVEFSYTDNGKIGVTAQRIPASTGNAVEVWYTTNINSTERQYSGKLISSGSCVTFTAQMAGLADGEYFTKIKANVGRYDKDYVSYVASRGLDPTSGYGTTFGRLLTADEATYSNFASMKMYDTSSDESTATPVYYTVKVTGTAGEIPLAMEQAYVSGSLERVPILSKTSATAGDTITLNGLISSSAYPYSNNNIITDPVIYIRLPEKITVENLRLYRETGRTADKVFLVDAVTETNPNPSHEEIASSAYEFKEITAASTAAGDTAATSYKLYKIEFKSPEKVGWFTDSLAQYQLGISFDMKIAKDAEAMTLDMRDCVRVMSRTAKSTSNNGTLSQYQVFDTYDMDGDGTDNERFSTFNVNAAGTKLSVVAARLGLTFTFGARMVDLANTAPDYNPGDYTNYENGGNKVLLTDANHAVDMLFTLKNETGRSFTEAEAKAFYYFIPVPKSGDLWDSHMQDKAFEFNMALAGEPTVAGISKDNVLVKYSTTVDSKAASGEALHYSNPDNYVDASAITDWNTVKMIRIAVKDTSTGIRNNAELKVYMHLKPEFESNAKLVGSVVNFGPCGVSPYSVGMTTNQGHNPLPHIQIEFQTGVIKGRVFLDKDYDGKYTDGTDELYTKDVEICAPHWNSVEDKETTPSGDNDSHKTTAKNGEYIFTGRLADMYHVIVSNPGEPDRSSNNPLRFSLPTVGSRFSVGGDLKTATASATLAKGAGEAVLDIGLQQPHKVTFKAENAVLDGAGGEKSVNVWHNDKLTVGDVPAVTVDSGYKFIEKWSDGTKSYTLAELKGLTVTADMSFTAEVKKLYSVSYNGNGSSAHMPETSWHIEGEGVTPSYVGTADLKLNGAIFVGWSLECIAGVLDRNAAPETISKIISSDEHTMPNRDVTLYAVWAEDDNGNGSPDYNDEAVHVRYHGNNGDRRDVICPHYHVVGETVQLSTSAQNMGGRLVDHDDPGNEVEGSTGSFSFTYEDNIFIGWSSAPILDTVIQTKARYDSLESSILKDYTVKMLEKAPAGTPDADAADTSKYADEYGSTNVYAVWAADSNKNGNADYTEERRLAYEANARSGGTVNGVPVDNAIYLPGNTVTVSSDKPTHSDVEGKKVAFVCWTTAPVDGILERSGNLPENKAASVVFGGEDITLYAAWGYDEDGNGTADVLETYTLRYDLNGGSGTVPPAVTGIEKRSTVRLTADTDFTRGDNELFAGWSITEKPDAFTAADGDEMDKTLIKTGNIIFGTEDITLYAVWAEDKNGNGAADFAEVRHIVYNGNPCRGTVISTTVPQDNAIYLPGDMLVLSQQIPTHSDVDGKAVAFIGWTAAAQDKLLSIDDDKPQTLTEFVFGDADVTVYAAWGYDEDGNGVADVLEAYVLSYDLNGGSPGQGVSYETQKLLPGASLKLKAAPQRSGYVFDGWKDEDGNIYQPESEIVMGADLKLTAQWLLDSSDDDPQPPEDIVIPPAPSGLTETGDSAAVPLWLTLLAISGAGIAALMVCTWRRRKEKQ